jgi:hypothetical protein
MDRTNWWNLESDGAWDRVKEALQRDWDQTRHDLHLGGHELNQKLGDTMGQAAGNRVMPPIDVANPPKVIGRWEDAEIPIGFGYAARREFGGDYPEWNDALEARLQAYWKAAAPWRVVRNLVRHGYEIKQ